MSEPTFTIIIPTYNGGAHFQRCLESVWAQTYPYFDVAILDDGSSDGTLDWLSAQDDPRLCVYPAPHHLGIEANWARAKTIPRKTFMTILGQDDLFDPNYLQVMRDLICRDPDASLYHAHFRFIDNQGKILSQARPMPEGETAAEYITALFSGQRDTYGSGYLMRSTDYDAVGGIPNYPGILFADDALWISLMQRGYKACASEECFSCRRHAASAGASSSWRRWTEAMAPYAAFLQTIAAQDPAIQAAIQQHAFSYLRLYCRDRYLGALLEANRKNQRLAPQVLQSMNQLLADFPSPDSEPINALRGIRLRETINRFALLRWTYNLIGRLRHAQEGLP